MFLPEEADTNGSGDQGGHKQADLNASEVVGMFGVERSRKKERDREANATKQAQAQERLQAEPQR
jgi:hypothetical protein